MTQPAQVEETVESPASNAADPSELSSSASTMRTRAVHVALLVFVAVAMFWRVFFLGETLIDVNTLNNQLPWGYDAPSTDYAYNRRDLTDMYVTRDYFVVAAYRDGEFPFWNPYTMAGHPIYADGVTRTLSPFLLFYKFFDIPLGYSIARITELILAAIFMYVFLVGIGVGPFGALMGSLVFEMSAHSMLHLTGLGWWGGLMWMPLILLFVDRAARRSSITQAALAGLFLAAQFYCGYIPNQIYYVAGIVFVYLFLMRGRAVDKKRVAASMRALSLSAVTLGVGFMVAATQWVPTLELLRQSNRRIVGAELGFIFLPPWYLCTLVFPNLFGTAYDSKALTLFTALGVSHDHILYIGIAGLAIAAYALFWLKATRGKGDAETRGQGDAGTRRRVACFAWLAAISLIVMMAAPLYVPITRFIPILQVIRVAVRAGVLFLLSASVLVGFGTDLMMARELTVLSKYSRLARRFLTATTAFAGLAVTVSFVLKATGFAVDLPDRGKLAFVRRSAALLSQQFLPPTWSILLPLIFITATVFVIIRFGNRRLSRQAAFGSLVGLLIVDLFWCDSQFNNAFERARVYPRTEITDKLKSLPPGRVLVVPSDLESNRRVTEESDKIIAPPNTLLAYRIPTVSGKNQQFPRSYRELASLIEPQPNLSHVVFDQPSSPIFDLLNVRYVLTHSSVPGLADYSLLARAEGISLFENRHALPRAFFPRTAIVVNSPAESLSAMRNADFDPRAQVVIEAEQRDLRALQGLSEPRDGAVATESSARIVTDQRNRVVIETDNANDGLLVLSDNFYPGWRADVDGSPTDIFRADHSLRAVSVPAGSHVVTFSFMPVTFTLSVYVSVISFFVVTVGLVAWARSPRRQILEQE